MLLREGAAQSAFLCVYSAARRRALEHEMLEQVRHAGLARPFVARADAVAHVHRGLGAGVVRGQQHLQAQPAQYDQIMERYYLAADYAQSQVDSYTYDDSQLDAYYEEHADELDTFTLSQFVFQARVNTVDDEGNTSQRNVLIEDGILKGYIQDSLNARLMGVAPTGNGRRESYAHAPMPRMTNTFMLAGTEDPASILSGLEDGIYAVGFGGGQVDITNGKFVFSCTEAYRVKNGEVGDPIRGATLIGDGATALRQIRAIGNDLSLDPGIGNCGKQGQWVPVGVGLPSLRIGGLTIGGSSS